ncbi:MAG: NADH-quinone oxidoreductase subunit NuoH, partial [Pseudomonas sp.]
MTWFTPEVIDVIIAVVKAIVILLAVVVAGALLSFVERRLLGWW